MRTDDFEPVERVLRSAVPEIADGSVEIKAAARITGVRTKIAVHPHDLGLDCVAACVGESGDRIKAIVDAFGGERIDILRWSDDAQVFIRNCLQPAEIVGVEIDPSKHLATVLVCADQHSLATGKRRENQELACRLSGYEIEIEVVNDAGN
jgi:N utilization substance protein A